MKNTLRSVLAAALALSASMPAFALQDCELDGKQVNPDNGATTAGKTGILRCRDRDSGQLLREQELKNGQYLGLVRHYRNGKLEQEYSVNARGNRDGRARQFDPESGRLLRDETLADSRNVGLAQTFHKNGQRARIGFYADNGEIRAYADFNTSGQLSGLLCADRPLLGAQADETTWCGFGAREAVVTTLYGNDGNAREKLSYREGRVVAAESFWRNGKPQRRETFDANGGGTEQRYDEQGVKRKETHWLPSGRGRVKESEQEFHDSGALIHEQRWIDGLLASERHWYLNGQLREESSFEGAGGARLRHSKQYHDNGSQAFTGDFRPEGRYNEIPVGVQQRFDAAGRPQQESTYDERGRLTRQREFDAAGNVTRDDAVFEDGSRKAYATPAR
ncbi:MAG: hypothetical protein KF778_15800 [Rhodocyclaceae bacterium]|nr:hypothetical protein [Rhodocyclaceae bacterium]MBX3669866.1 hypothetical protein [Rhodocyclaceae bacterium]